MAEQQNDRPAMSNTVTDGRTLPIASTSVVVKPSERQKVSMMQTRLRDMITLREEYSNQWDKNLDNYLMTDAPNKEDWQAKGQSALLFGVVEGIMAELLDVTPAAELIPLDPDVPQTDVEQLNKLAQLILSQRENNLHTLYALKEAVLNGTGILEVGYQCEERPYKFMVPKIAPDGTPERDDSGKVKYHYEEEVVTTKDEITIRRVPLNRFLIDPYATSIDDADDAIVMEWYSYDQFRNKFQGQDFYKNIDKVRPMSRTTTSPSYGGGSLDPKLQRIMLPGTKQFVHVIKYYNRATDEFLTMANNVLIRNTPNPYADKHRLPFTAFRLSPVLDRFYGMGMGEAMRSEQEHLSTMLRIAIDQSKIASTPPTIMSQQMGIDDDQLMLRPGKIVHVDGDVGQAQVMQVPDISNSLMRMFDKLDEESRMASGFDSRLLQGASSSTTAYEYGIRRELQMKRLAAAVKIMEKEGMQPLLEMVLSRLQQFYTNPRVYRGFNGTSQRVVAYPTIIARIGDGEAERMTITEKLATAMQGEWRVIAKSTAEVGKSKVAERSSALEVINTLSKFTMDPNAAPGEDPRILSVKKLIYESGKKLGVDMNKIAPDGEYQPPPMPEPEETTKMNLNVRADLAKMPPEVQEIAMKKVLGEEAGGLDQMGEMMQGEGAVPSTEPEGYAPPEENLAALQSRLGTGSGAPFPGAQG